MVLNSFISPVMIACSDQCPSYHNCRASKRSFFYPMGNYKTHKQLYELVYPSTIAAHLARYSDKSHRIPGQRIICRNYFQALPTELPYVNKGVVIHYSMRVFLSLNPSLRSCCAGGHWYAVYVHRGVSEGPNEPSAVAKHANQSINRRYSLYLPGFISTF